MTEGAIERSRRRLEDRRFLTGQGRYVDDMDVAGQLHGIVLRSPHGHALIEGIDTGAAPRAALGKWRFHRGRSRC
jgi:carbon-monoxide dehydrogenase large subunit